MKLGNSDWTQNLGWAIALAGTFSGGGSAFALQSGSINDLTPTVYAGVLNGDSPTIRVTTDPLYAGVGSVSVGCTGAAISSTHVLSAAHCFDPNSPNVSFRLNNTDYAGVVSIFPGAVFPFNDVAVITLGQSLPVSTPIYQLFRNPIPLGSEIQFVGFGASGDGVTGNSLGFDPNVKRLGSNVVDFFYSENGGFGATSTTNRTALISWVNSPPLGAAFD